MFTEFALESQAVERALALADMHAAPILVMRNYWGNFSVGLRTERAVRKYGQHVATCHRSGLVERFDSKHDCELSMGLRSCLCQ